MGTMEEPELARVARLIGEPARAAMLSALLSGESLPAGELARRAGVAAATASEHLARLTEGGLVVRRRSGRHTYFALAGSDVAAVLEALARISAPPTSSRGASKSSVESELRFARTCYDHLAGTLGVLVTGTMLERELIAGPGFALTDRGTEWLASLQIDADELRRGRRGLTRPCLDWSERRDHLAGAVAAAITNRMLDQRWLVRLEGSRAVRLTQRGREGLRRSLELEVPIQSG